MFKYSAILLGLIMTSFYSWSQKYEFEGELIYYTNDPIQEGIPLDSASYIKYFVKKEEVRVENITQMGKQIYLINHREKKAVLMLHFGDKKFALIQDLSIDTIRKAYSIKKACKSQKVGEIKGKQLSIRGEHLKEPLTIFYSPKHPNYIVDVYDKCIPGLPLSYHLIIQGDKVMYELIKLEEKLISDKLFSVPEDYIIMTMEEFLQNLSPE